MCVLEAGEPVAAAIREVSSRGAFLETNARPVPGTAIRLRHPLAGAIGGQVSAVASDGITVAFACDAASTGFAIGVIASTMIEASL